MKNYMVLYMAPAATVKKFLSQPPEKVKAVSEEWLQWNTDHPDVIVDEGSPLNKTMRVDRSGATDTKNEITGYEIVQAKSLEDAAHLLENHPSTKFEGGWIEIMEAVPMPGI